MKIFYLANIRLPTEKAHGLQIMQNCEAFQEVGAGVTLYVAWRVNTPELAAVRDVYAHYGVRPSFGVRRIASLDLFPFLERLSPRLAGVAFGIQVVTYTIALFLTMLFRRAEVYYSRDMLTLLSLSLIKPRARLVYEAHQRSKGRIGRRIQGWCVRRVGLTAAVTGRLANDLRAMGAKKVITAPDGYRMERFADLPAQPAARAQLGIARDLFLVGYVGRLHTMHMGKGVDDLIDAAAACERPIGLCLVGGPDDMAAALQRRWVAAGLPPERFLAAGHVAAERVPLYIAAFDACAMPFPFTEHFAYYASPLKLFEYMAAGKPIVASDLPSTGEIVRHDEGALLYPPADVTALAAALRRLHDDPVLRTRLGKKVGVDAAQYTWAARARMILAAITG